MRDSEEEEVVELKFRLYDGSDIGPFTYSPASTVATLKDRILAHWPKGLFSFLLFLSCLHFYSHFIFAASVDLAFRKLSLIWNH